MFKHVFNTMQDILQDIIIHYPHANDTERQRLDEQLAKLKQFSDQFIEEWLQFEEKMADFRDMQQQFGHGPAAGESQPAGASPKETAYPKIISAVPQAAQQAAGPAVAGVGLAGADDEDWEASAAFHRSMSKGQGYFKLLMFREAASHFEEAVDRSPENNQARLFLGMTFMHLQEWHDAQRHFQLLVEITEHPRWRALGLNALGCIQAVRMNLEQAAVYFEKAHQADPNFTDPLANMQSCAQHAGQLSLYFGSGQL
ncbi:hypothetical protein SAMN02799624_01324 [Paenibacillus sp. UNC496MF]|uniref:tetratricopeptide repeat protein n=1 Tax=Paenibacillus sp. UNC496MF TaxID=1502753 RepID=UPI0008F2FC5F|nr:tetratricopeptide repeat protein [Paenibacillus sp. UNC496MF]SFI55012.1 hypothetical protein SAMN02799624_01324 [Paenibacillus sp. UNC496MF]